MASVHPNVPGGIVWSRLNIERQATVNTKSSKKGLRSPNLVVPVRSPVTEGIIRKMTCTNVELDGHKEAGHRCKCIRETERHESLWVRVKHKIRLEPQSCSSTNCAAYVDCTGITSLLLKSQNKIKHWYGQESARQPSCNLARLPR